MKRLHPAIVLLALAAAACSRTATEAPQESSVLVQTTLVHQQALIETTVLYGEVTADVGASENVSFARPVRISRLLVSSGQRVKRNQPLLEVETDPNAASAYTQAQSALDLARKELKSTTQLARERLATQSQLAAVRKTVTDAESALKAQQAMGAAPGKQIVRADRDGVIATLTAQQGDRVQAGVTVLQLSSAGARRALLGAEPEDVGRLGPGMAVEVLPVFGGTPAAATITQVFGVINPQTRLVDVAVETRDTAGQLIPGLKVKGKVTLRTLEAWAVPRTAVLQDAAGAYLFQVTAGKARRISVKQVIDSGPLVGVQGKLDPASPVVTLGNYELSDGMTVKVQQ